MDILKAQFDDLVAILELQYLAYQSEAMRYNDFSIPPLTQTIDELIIESKNSIVIKAVIDGVIVGSARGVVDGDECLVTRIIVNPDNQRQGIGTKLLLVLEDYFGGVESFVLYTGTNSVDNIRLYKRNGYAEFKEEKLTENITFVYLRKKIKQLHKLACFDD